MNRTADLSKEEIDYRIKHKEEKYWPTYGICTSCGKLTKITFWWHQSCDYCYEHEGLFSCWAYKHEIDKDLCNDCPIRFVCFTTDKMGYSG